MSYADDSTLLKVIPTKDLRLSAAAEINADLSRITVWGKSWYIEFSSQLPFVCHLNMMLRSIPLYL